jgi:hypothetical protein
MHKIDATPVVARDIRIRSEPGSHANPDAADLVSLPKLIGMNHHSISLPCFVRISDAIGEKASGHHRTRSLDGTAVLILVSEIPTATNQAPPSTQR